MSHNDGMPDTKEVEDLAKVLYDNYEMGDWEAEDVLKKGEYRKDAWKLISIGYTRADRKTMDEKELDKQVQHWLINNDLGNLWIKEGVWISDIIIKYLKEFAPPTEKNTPEKKLVEKISFYKLLTLVRDHRNKYNGIDVSKYDLDNETDRRNLGLAIQQIYEEIYKTFAIPERRVPTAREMARAFLDYENEHKDCTTLEAMEHVHALIAKKEEKK